MTALLVAAAVIAGAGAIAALAPLDVRLGLIGLATCLVGAALLSDPLPEPAILAVRLTGALLAVALLRASGVAAMRAADGDGRGWSGHLTASEVGWPAEALLGAAGAVAGLAIAAAIGTPSVGGADVGQPATIAPTDLLGASSLALALAGLIAAIAIGSLVADPHGLRRSIAAVLVVEAVLLARSGLVMTSSALEEIVFAALVVTVAAAASALLAAPGRQPMTARRP